MKSLVYEWFITSKILQMMTLLREFTKLQGCSKTFFVKCSTVRNNGARGKQIVLCQQRQVFRAFIFNIEKGFARCVQLKNPKNGVEMNGILEARQTEINIIQTVYLRGFTRVTKFLIQKVFPWCQILRVSPRHSNSRRLPNFLHFLSPIITIAQYQSQMSLT